MSRHVKVWVTKLNRWYRERKFLKAYVIMRNEFEKHRDAGHEVEFEVTDVDHMFLRCYACPDLYPQKKRA